MLIMDMVTIIIANMSTAISEFHGPLPIVNLDDIHTAIPGFNIKKIFRIFIKL